MRSHDVRLKDELDDPDILSKYIPLLRFYGPRTSRKRLKVCQVAKDPESDHTNRGRSLSCGRQTQNPCTSTASSEHGRMTSGTKLPLVLGTRRKVSPRHRCCEEHS